MNLRLRFTKVHADDISTNGRDSNVALRTGRKSLVHHLGPDLNISATIGWLMEFITDVNVPQSY